MEKTVLITGATSGIGLATAKELVKKGWIVILHGRTLKKANEATRIIQEATPNATIIPIEADLTSLAEVKALAAKIEKYTPSVIVHNATAANFDRGNTSDGDEITFAVGQLAPWILNMHLAPQLNMLKSAGIVWISSQSHTAARLIDEDIIANKIESADQSYARTKLANLATCFALAETWKHTNIQNVAFDPGPTETPLMAKLRDNNHGIKGWLLKNIVPLFSHSAESVAQDLAWTVDQSLLQMSQGQYFGFGRKRIRASIRAHNKVRQEMTIEAMEKRTGVSLNRLLNLSHSKESGSI